MPLASPHKQPSRSQGFTLIELMITVVILSLLTLVAIPSYTQFVTKARRADGETLLLDMAARQERFYYDNSAFTQALTAIGYSADSNVNSPDGYYKASAVTATGCVATDYTGGECYVLKAVPQGDQSGDKNLFLTFSGEKWRDKDADSAFDSGEEWASN